jgi:ketosteroid isomerase-like protein
MKLLAGIALAASLLFVPAVANAQIGSVDTKADLEKAAMEWMNAYNSKDGGKVAQMYATMRRVSSPGWTAIGRAALEEGLKKDTAAGVFSKINSITVDQSHRVGDMNYAMGAWTADMKGPEGKDVPVSGHWLSVSRYRDGNYIILAHSINMAIPPPK